MRSWRPFLVEGGAKIAACEANANEEADGGRLSARLPLERVPLFVASWVRGLIENSRHELGRARASQLLPLGALAPAGPRGRWRDCELPARKTRPPASAEPATPLDQVDFDFRVEGLHEGVPAATNTADWTEADDPSRGGADCAPAPPASNRSNWIQIGRRLSSGPQLARRPSDWPRDQIIQLAQPSGRGARAGPRPLKPAPTGAARLMRPGAR